MLIALSLFLPFFLGLGFLALHLHPALFSPLPKARPDSARLLFLAAALGVLVNYALVLMIGNLTASLIIGAALSLGGHMLTARSLGKSLPDIFRLGWFSWVVIGYLVILYAVVVLFVPLQDWDARSIWFFHGKMIFYNQAMDAAAGWDQPFAGFSHVGYPKLVPILAAQFGTCAGFWNEFFPKAGLLALLIPAIIGMFSFFRKPSMSSIFLIVMWLFSLGFWLWNGYMDGYMALYAGLAVLFVTRWLQSGDAFDALSGIVSLAVTVSLKNEGLLLVASVFLAVLVFLPAWRTRAPGQGLSFPVRLWPIAGIAFLGFALWFALRYSWGLPSAAPSSLTDWHLYGERLRQGAAGLIADALLIKAGVAKGLLLVVCSGAACLLLKRRLPRTAWFPVLAAGIYGSGLFLIYWTTNSDLAWHLGTSATRTMLPVLHILFTATYVILLDLEGAPSDIAAHLPMTASAVGRRPKKKETVIKPAAKTLSR